jgi:hypothetical protein
MGDEQAVQLPVIPPDEDPIAVQLPVIPEDGIEAEEDAGGTDPSGEGEPPVEAAEGEPEPEPVEDAAIVVGAIAGEAAARVLQMTAKGRKNIDSTFSAWVLGQIKTPEQQLAEFRAEAERRVAAQRANGANDGYLRKQLVGNVAGIKKVNL